MTTVPKIACCIKEAVAQAMGNEGCEDPNCNFAHSIKEAKKNFFAAAAASGKPAFFQKLLATQHPVAEAYGGRLMPNKVFYTMKFEDYIRYFQQVLVPFEIAKIDSVLDSIIDEESTTDENRIEAFLDEQNEFVKEEELLAKYYEAEQAESARVSTPVLWADL